MSDPTWSEIEVGEGDDVVGRLRAFVRGTASGWHLSVAEAADLQLLVAELVTNAVRHGRPPYRLALADVGDHVRLEVTDRGHGRPRLCRVDLDSESGRGLVVVDCLAARWGVKPGVGATSAEEGEPPAGPTVWAELEVRRRRRAADRDQP